jgi:WD40 repeat protein
MSSTTRDTVFISYSQDDREWLDRVLEFLKPLTDNNRLRIWADRSLEVGGDWRAEIDRELGRTRVALLLVTPAFLASDFIRDVELPALSEGALNEDLTLVWVLVETCLWKQSLLSRHSAGWDPSRPLEGLSREECNKALDEIATKVADAAGVPRDRTNATASPRKRSPQSAGQGALYNVPGLPVHYRPRKDDLNRLRRVLLARKKGSRRQSVGLHGEGGIGKSVLAAALAQDGRVRRSFPDGVFWVTLGQSPDRDQLQAALVASAIATGDSRASTPQEWSTRLADWFGNSAALVILDDVWHAEDARAFDVLGPASRLLVTTRDAAVLSALGAEELVVRRLARTHALELMASWAATDVKSLSADAHKVARWCDGLPLALRLAGANARDDRGWSRVRNGLELGRLDVIEHESGSVSRSMRLSVDALAPRDRECYLQLRVFRKGEPVPERVVLALWRETAGLDGIDGPGLLTRLRRKALLELQGPEEGRAVSLHDLQHDYIQPDGGDRVALHEAVVSALAAHLPAGLEERAWWRLPRGDRYAWNHLAAHLAGAGRREELRRLLLDYRWIEAKVRTAGLLSVLPDFETLTGDEDVEMVARALRLSAHVLLADPAQLRSQLTGRLLEVDRPAIRAILDQAAATARGTWLRPVSASLFSPVGPLLTTLTGHLEPVHAVALTPDGRHAISGSRDGAVMVWDLETYGTGRLLAHRGEEITAVAALPGSRYAISGAADGVLRVWDLLARKEAYTLKGDGGAVRHIAVSRDGRHAVSTASDGLLRGWDLQEKRLKWTRGGSGSRVRAVALASKDMAVSADDGGVLTLWNLVTVTEERRLPGRARGVVALAIAPDGHRIISGSADGTIQFWDLEAGLDGRLLSGHTEGITALAVTENGARAISSSSDHTVRMWDLETGVEERRLAGHAKRVLCVAITPEGRTAVSASADLTLKLWSLEGRGEDRLAADPDGIRSIAVTPDGKSVISAPYDGTLRIWDLATAEQTGQLPGHGSRVLAVKVAQDGSHAVSGDSEGTLKVWNLETREEHSLPGHVPHGIWSVATTPDGRRIVSASADHTLKVWNAATRTEERPLIGHSDTVTALAIDPDGRLVVSSSKDHTLKVWDLATGELKFTFPDHGDWVTSVAITPDGTRAVSGSDDRTVKVWSLETGDVEQTLPGHTSWVNAVAVAQDGRLVVSASEDWTIRVWNLATDALLATFTTDSALHCCAIAPDGVRLVAGDRLGRVHFLLLENVPPL